MVQVAGFRGALLNPYKVDNVSAVAAMALTGVKSKLLTAQLVRDSHASVYRYHQTFGERTRKTTLVAVELQPWTAGVIRAHEETSPMARELATRGITNEAAHTDGVFCGYRDPARHVDYVLAACEKQQPALVVKTNDGTVHTVWRESDPEVIDQVRAWFADQQLHVLDGNGRYEGMLAYRDAFDELAPRSAAKFGLACLANLDDPAIALAPRHRVVRGPRSRADVLGAAKPYFTFDRIAGAAEDVQRQRDALAGLGDAPGFLALFPDDPDAWLLKLLPAHFHTGAQMIDPVVVEEVFLGKVVPGSQPRSVLEVSTVIKAVDDGAVGLILRPIKLEHILRAEETGKLLPFGSTAFCPALARLVTYVIDPAETLR